MERLGQGESSCNRGASLIESCQKNDSKKVETLLPELTSEEINYQDKNGETIFSMCCEINTDLALKIINTGNVDVNLCNNHGFTPLHRVCSNGNEELATALLSLGANINQRSKKGTPLHIATSYGHPTIATLLIAKGADCTLEDENCGTPLYDLSNMRYAVVSCQPRLVCQKLRYN
jgi:ankyrin repeat protein